MEHSIQASNLEAAYGKKQALKGINFCVEKGDVFAILGPNGAGKSTIIAILATLLTPSKGTIQIEGHLGGVENAKIRRKIGLVFQQSVLDVLLSVKDNLHVRCGLYSTNKQDIQARVEDICEQCELHNFYEQKVSTLSGGERRRADIARALLAKPEILILDEPCAGLDTNARKNVWETILYLKHRYHMTIVMTTHDMEEAEQANHICILKEGTIIINDQKDKIKDVFGKQHLQLYTTAMQKVKKILAQHHIAYKQQEQGFSLAPMNHFQTMSILRKCERYIEHFELRQSCLNEVYVHLLKEEKHESTNKT